MLFKCLSNSSTSGGFGEKLKYFGSHFERSKTVTEWSDTSRIDKRSLLQRYALQFRPKGKWRRRRRWRPQSQWTTVVCYPFNLAPSRGVSSSGCWATPWRSTAAVRFLDSGIEPATSCPKEPELPGRRGVVGIRTAEVRRLDLAAKLKLFPGSGSAGSPELLSHNQRESWQLIWPVRLRAAGRNIPVKLII